MKQLFPLISIAPEMLKTRISAALSAGRQTVSPGQTASTRRIASPGQTVSTRRIVSPGQTASTQRILPGGHPPSTRLQIFFILLVLVLVQSCRTPEPAVTPEPEPVDPREAALRDAVADMLAEIYETQDPVRLAPGVRIRRMEVDDEALTADIHLNVNFSYAPMRPETVDALYEMLHERLPRRFRNYEVTLYSLNEPIDQLIPNIYRRSTEEYDLHRMPYADEIRPRPIVQRHGRLVEPAHGLEGRQIALWHSHGWYYDQQKKRWEWQRPRLFQTVEDMLPMAFTLPYIIPMLENAGAHVWVPRERDMQHHEAIVDFDGSTGDSRVVFSGTWEDAAPGFAIGSLPYTGNENPFRQGSYRYRSTSKDGEAVVQWVPDIPEAGKYAVYVSYASLEESADDAFYSVFHRGGRTGFTVNQTIGGGTWVYLGHFEFDEGVNPDQGRVELTNYSWRPAVVTADAVRFGGGMGIVEREGQTGGRPRYLEAGRYYMQFAGMPDTLVHGLSEGRSDVVDDFQGRGEWVNYLRGAPFGPNVDREVPGLGIPIDLSLAFHTDAGITRNDTVVGTLMIYSIEDGDSLRAFPDKVSRLANRDLGDIMQTEIVEDIRRTWDPAWNRRHLFNRMYSEAARPNVPAVLLELLSHQNFLDMQYGLDPRFRFDVSRSIYKSMLRFIADRHQLEYVVQPLPVSNFRVFPTGRGEVMLRWEAVPDTLEPTADPDRYIVYKKRGDAPFDSGRLTTGTELVVPNLDPGVMYQFKVVAANDGGVSFPSETLAVALSDERRRPVLIVNGFERISGPAIVDEPDFKGFTNFLDPGVPDRYDISFTGDQFDFDPDSQWRTNDAPGHGASHADYETLIVPGNTFAFPAVYGETLVDMGVPFASASVASIRDRQVDMNDYDAVILIMGKQKSTPWPKHDLLERDPAFQVFPERLRQELARYLDLGGRLFVTGAHVGTDVAGRAGDDPAGPAFVRGAMRFVPETNHAARTGDVRAVSGNLLPMNTRFTFNTQWHPEIYRVDAPDAIEPYGKPIEPGVSSIDDGGAARRNASRPDAQPVREADGSEVGRVRTLDSSGGNGAEADGEEGSGDAESGVVRSYYTDSMFDEAGGAQRMPSLRREMVPAGPETLIRYEENQFSAGVGYRTEHRAVVTFGFPFETIVDPGERREVLQGVMQYLGVPVD